MFVMHHQPRQYISKHKPKNQIDWMEESHLWKERYFRSVELNMNCFFRLDQNMSVLREDISISLAHESAFQIWLVTTQSAKVYIMYYSFAPHDVADSFICGDFLAGMMTSSNWNILRVTGPFRGEYTGYRWIHLTRASDSELWCFLSAPEQTVEQTVETPVIWDTIALIMTSL